jgi:hypothetical protein
MHQRILFQNIIQQTFARNQTKESNMLVNENDKAKLSMPCHFTYYLLLSAPPLIFLLLCSYALTCRLYSSCPHLPFLSLAFTMALEKGCSHRLWLLFLSAVYSM